MQAGPRSWPPTHGVEGDALLFEEPVKHAPRERAEGASPLQSKRQALDLARWRWTQRRRSGRLASRAVNLGMNNSVDKRHLLPPLCRRLMIVQSCHGSSPHTCDTV